MILNNDSRIDLEVIIILAFGGNFSDSFLKLFFCEPFSGFASAAFGFR